MYGSVGKMASILMTSFISLGAIWQFLCIVIALHVCGCAGWGPTVCLQ